MRLRLSRIIVDGSWVLIGDLVIKSSAFTTRLSGPVADNFMQESILVWLRIGSLLRSAFLSKPNRAPFVYHFAYSLPYSEGTIPTYKQRKERSKQIAGIWIPGVVPAEFFVIMVNIIVFVIICIISIIILNVIISFIITNILIFDHPIIISITILI